jgi:predicted  nucleic acid-binding Zn-ribbon protein
MSRNFKNWPALWEHFMALFGGRNSMLEVQNQALLKSAGERTRRISELERELQQAGEALKSLRAEVERLKADVERLKGEREFYHKRVLALEQDNHDLAGVATKYSLWGQKLERELAKIDPDGASARRFGAGHEP